jgi:formylglycine-generating enzyme required for sulfatase activity
MFQPNAWGLFQVHGNVYDWVEDCYHDSYVGAPSDGSAWVSGDCSRRVIRGGSWNDHPLFLRSAYRLWSYSDNRNVIMGFRVGRTLAPGS